MPSLLPLVDNQTRLRPLQPRDADSYAEGSADLQVRRFGHLPSGVYTPAAVRQMIADEADPGLERGDLAVLALADLTTDAFAGSVVLFDVTRDIAEVGFWIRPDARGRNRAGTGLALAARFASGSGLSELRARTEVENSASRRVLARAGFVGVRRTVEAGPFGRRAELEHFRLPLPGSRPLLPS